MFITKCNKKWYVYNKVCFQDFNILYETLKPCWGHTKINQLTSLIFGLEISLVRLICSLGKFSIFQFTTDECMRVLIIIFFSIALQNSPQLTFFSLLFKCPQTICLPFLQSYNFSSQFLMCCLKAKAACLEFLLWHYLTSRYWFLFQ